MTILVIAEHDNQSLAPVTRNTVTAASQIANHLSSDIHVLVAGSNCAEVAQTAAGIEGVTKVLHIEAEAYANQLAENVAPLIESIGHDYSHIVAPASTTGKNILPRVAAMLDVQQISDISAVVDADTFIRPFYAGNALAKVKSNDPIKVLTVRTTTFDAAGDSSDSAEIQSIEAVTAANLSSFVSCEADNASERPDLGAARVVISGGRALKSAENFAIFNGLADKLDAAIGASRAAVDAGYIANEYQVGQTGRVVAPELYIAAGISGAIQHMAGMKDSKVIVAINTDPEAPIFKIADYGLVADLFEAIPELEQSI